MNVTQTNVIDAFVGGNEKAVYPNIEGAAISQNLITEVNNKNKYIRSLFGKKFFKQINEVISNCTGSFYASVGLNSNNNQPSSFWCFGSSVYEVQPSNVITNILNGKMDSEYGWSFVESGGERPFLLICDGNTLHAYNLYTGEVLLIQMPLGVTGKTIVPGSVSCLGGSIIVSDKNTGYAYYSQPYILSNDTMEIIRKDNDGNIVTENNKPLYDEVSVWEGNIFYDMYGTLQHKNAESSSDSIVRLNAVGDVLTVYGRSSIEFWTRSDAEGMTWVRTNYTSNNSLGLKNARTVGVFNNIQGFLGAGNRNGFGVYIIQGTEIEKVSPVWLDELLFKSSLTNVFAYGYSYSNHSFYCLHFKDSNDRERCFAYDILSGDWHERVSLNTNDMKLESTHYVYPIFTRNGQLLYANFNTKKYNALYESRKDYWYEDLTSNQKLSFIRTRQTPIIIEGEREFILNALSIEGNFGTCDRRDITPEAMLEISRDGGYTYGNTMTRALPRTGDYKWRVLWNGLGMVRNCVLKFSTSSPIDLCLQNASMTTVSLNYRL